MTNAGAPSEAVNASALVPSWKVSMLDSELFAVLDAAGRRIRGRPSVAFGGLQLVTCGDFFQVGTGWCLCWCRWCWLCLGQSTRDAGEGLPPTVTMSPSHVQLPPVGLGSYGKGFAFQSPAWAACGMRSFVLTEPVRQQVPPHPSHF